MHLFCFPCRVGWKMLAGLFWSAGAASGIQELNRGASAAGGMPGARKSSTRRNAVRLSLSLLLLLMGVNVRSHALSVYGPDETTLDEAAMKGFYMYIWKVFYLSYAILPFFQF